MSEFAPVSGLWWLPRIKSAGLPTPRTVFVPYDHKALVAVWDAESVPEAYPEKPSFDFGGLVRSVQAACRKIGYPCFIRTDLKAAKHAGPAAYKANGDGDVGAVVRRTIEDNETHLWMSPESPSAIMIREFLTLESPFSAFGFQVGVDDAPGHPIAREWRFFADAGRVRCAHPYWPVEAIKFGLKRTGRTLHDGSMEVSRDEPPGWREALVDLHKPLSTDEWNELVVMARMAAKSCGGDPVGWSVDFCRDVNGKWWLTDMAPADVSYHDPACPDKSLSGRKGR